MLTQEEFLIRAKKVHGDRYDYSKTVYMGMYKKIFINCAVHGLFEKMSRDHIFSKVGCPACSGCSKLTTESFLKSANRVHGDTYDYSLVNIVSSHSKIKIICREHGVFEQTPSNHIYGAQGCFKCGVESRKPKISAIRKASTGKQHRTEVQKIEASKRAKRLGIGSWLKGLKQSPESIRRGVEKRKGIKISDATRLKMSVAMCKRISQNKAPLVFRDTKPERAMENILRELGVAFKKQKYIKVNGRGYCDDFVLNDTKIIIEVAGLYWHNYPYGLNKDRMRDEGLRLLGYMVFRFWENKFDIYLVEQTLYGRVEMREPCLSYAS